MKALIAKLTNLIQTNLADPTIPKSARYLLIAAICYFAWPIDLVPDFIPVIGWLDDIIVPSILVYIALKLIKRSKKHVRKST